MRKLWRKFKKWLSEDDIPGLFNTRKQNTVIIIGLIVAACCLILVCKLFIRVL